MKDMFEYKQDEIEEVLACPWCSSKNYKPWGKPNRNFTPVKCDMCGVVFLNKRLNGKGRKRFYQSYVRLHETPERLKPRLRMYEIEFELINNIVTRGNVLDVGCGSGRFLSYFQPGHYKRFGVEYGKEAVNKIRWNDGKTTLIIQKEYGDQLSAPSLGISDYGEHYVVTYIDNEIISRMDEREKEEAPKF